MLPPTGPGLRTRKRVTTVGLPAGFTQFIPSSGTGLPASYYNLVVRQQQLTVDREHTGWPVVQRLLKDKDTAVEAKRRLRRYDHGGEFYSERQEYSEPTVVFHSRTRKQLVGTYISRVSQYGIPSSNIGTNHSIWPKLDPEEELDLWGKGAFAIKQCAPVLPATSLSTTIGELREGLPKLARKLGSIAAVTNTSASNFLGWQFGVKPLWNDIVKIRHALSDYDKTLARYERENGNLLHRGFRYDTETDTTLEDTTTTYAWPSPLSPTGPLQGVRETRLTTTYDTWFSGAFSYYFERHRSAVQDLMSWCDNLGVGVTPDTLYNLTPYSWLMDWFANYGDVVFNISYLFDNSQVMNYGYLMRTTKATRSVVWRSPAGNTTQEFSTIRKLRIRASPFGFGLNESDLTLTQKAILAALGITRVT